MTGVAKDQQLASCYGFEPVNGINGVASMSLFESEIPANRTDRDCLWLLCNSLLQKMSDSVSIFSEGTFGEQIQELVNYIVRNCSEEERAAFIRPFQEALRTDEKQKSIEEDEERKRGVFSMVLNEVKGFGEGSDKEIEGFFNLVYSHLFTLFPSDSPSQKQYLTGLLQTISASPSENASLQYRLLSNLFNAIPRKSPLRLPVYKTLLQIATARDELQVLQITRRDIETWLLEWDITPKEKSEFLKSIVDSFAKTGQMEPLYEYTLAYVRSLSPSDPSLQEAALEAIATALRSPLVFNFDSLLKLDAVMASKDHPLFSLLQVVLNSGLSEFNSWESSHPGVLEKYNLERTQLERKIRLLTFASLGFQNIGRDLPYSKIADSLQVEQSEVEKWAINVIRAGLLTGKISQTTQTIHIVRSTSRTFEREQWEALEKRLLAWKTSLAGVLEVAATARKRGETQQSGSQSTTSAPPQTVAT